METGAGRFRVYDLWPRTLVDATLPDGTIKGPPVSGAASKTISGSALAGTIGPNAQASPSGYSLVGHVGEGGMGVVYMAKHTALSRVVALKMMHPKAATDRQSHHRFVTEAVVTGRLEHPNIVPVYDLGTVPDGRPFYTMKHVKGTPWRSVMRAKTLPENLDILLRVADAVAFAHSRGILHRDIKPSNVMLGDFGEVLLIDWGLAVQIGVDGRFAGEDAPSGGTPAYMPPEMAWCDSSRLSASSDVYLLGAVLHEILTGVPPHPGNDSRSCLRSAAHNLIEPLDGHGELQDVALKAMATDPAMRYGDARAFAAALRAYLTHSQSSTLAEQAADRLRQATATGDYGLFAEALYGFRNALSLWADNRPAADGLARVRVQYADCALARGDLDLAASLLTTDEPGHRSLLDRIAGALAVRAEEKRRLGLAIHEAYFFRIRLAMQRYEEGHIALADEFLAECPPHFRHLEWGLVKSLCHQELMTLIGHEDAVLSADFSPDGRHLASCARDATVCLWDARSGERLWTASAHAKSTQARVVRFSPNGGELATGGRFDGQIKVWEIPSGRLVRTIQTGHQVPGRPIMDLVQLAYSPDGRMIASLGAGRVEVRLAATGDLLQTMETGATSRMPGQIAWSPDGRLIGASTKTHARIWNASNGALVKEIPGERSDPMSLSLAFDPTGRWLVDGCGRVHDLETNQMVFAIGHGAQDVRFSPDGRFLAGSVSRRIQVWDAQTGRTLLTGRGHDGGIASTAWSPDSRRLVSASDDRTVKVWDALEPRQSRTFSMTARRIHFTADGDHVVAVSAEEARLWHIPSGQERVVIALPEPPKGGDLGADRAFCRRRGLIAAAGQAGIVQVWDMMTGRHVRDYPISCIMILFSESGRHLIVGNRERPVEMLDIESGSVVSLATRATVIACSPDERYVATVVTDESHVSARVLDLTTQQERAIVGRGTPPSWLLFHPTNGLLVALDSGLVLFYDIHQGRLVKSLRGHDGGLENVAFTSDGLRVVSSGWRGDTRIWEYESGREILCIRHGAELNDMALSPNNRRIAVACKDGAVRVYEAADWNR